MGNGVRRKMGRKKLLEGFGERERRGGGRKTVKG